MKIIYALHFYQPDFQFKEILEKVYHNSYIPILEAIKNSSRAKIAINITGSTLELFRKYEVGDLVQELKDLYKTGKIEFITTSFSHTLLPYATETQAKRRIELNVKTLRELLDLPEDELTVLFPPEFNIDQKSLDLAKSLGVKAVFVSHNSINKFNENHNKLDQNGLKLFVRSSKVSRLLENINIKNKEEFWDKVNDLNLENNETYFALHDAEILGFAFPQKIEFFKQILDDSKIEFGSFKEELENNNLKTYKSKVQHATWERMPIRDQEIDPHWSNKENKIHLYQWKLSNLVISYVEKLVEEGCDISVFQQELDHLQYSCQYWWASSYPFWSPGIIAHAAWNWLKFSYEIFNSEVGNKDKEFITKANKYYSKIIQTLADYETSGWSRNNISYYDQNLHPLKLNSQI